MPRTIFRNILFFATLIALLVSAPITPVVNAQTKVGKTILARGEVQATLDGATRRLKRRAVIYERDNITTGKKSRAQFRMKDKAVIALQENSILNLADYRYAHQTDNNKVHLNLIKGGLRTVTGIVGKQAKGDYQLSTPIAVIGIRGTHFEVELAQEQLFVAVWEGEIDLSASLCSSTLGQSRGASVAIVSSDGNCSFPAVLPEVFKAGHAARKEEAAMDETVEDQPTSNEKDDDASSTQQESVDDETTNEVGDDSPQLSDDEPQTEALPVTENPFESTAPLVEEFKLTETPTLPENITQEVINENMDNDPAGTSAVPTTQPISIRFIFN